MRCFADQLIYPACEPLFRSIQIRRYGDTSLPGSNSRRSLRFIVKSAWQASCSPGSLEIDLMSASLQKAHHANKCAGVDNGLFHRPILSCPREVSRAGTPMTDSQHRRGGGRRGGGGWQQGHGSREPRDELKTTGCHRRWSSLSPIPIFTTTTTSCSVRSRAASPARRQRSDPAPVRRRRVHGAMGRGRSPRLLLKRLGKKASRRRSLLRMSEMEVHCQQPAARRDRWK